MKGLRVILVLLSNHSFLFFRDAIFIPIRVKKALINRSAENPIVNHKIITSVNAGPILVILSAKFITIRF